MSQSQTQMGLKPSTVLRLGAPPAAAPLRCWGACMGMGAPFRWLWLWRPAAVSRGAARHVAGGLALESWRCPTAACLEALTSARLAAGRWPPLVGCSSAAPTPELRCVPGAVRRHGRRTTVAASAGLAPGTSSLPPPPSPRLLQPSAALQQPAASSTPQTANRKPQREQPASAAHRALLAPYPLQPHPPPRPPTVPGPRSCSGRPVRASQARTHAATPKIAARWQLCLGRACAFLSPCALPVLSAPLLPASQPCPSHVAACVLGGTLTSLVLPLPPRLGRCSRFNVVPLLTTLPTTTVAAISHLRQGANCDSSGLLSAAPIRRTRSAPCPLPTLDSAKGNTTTLPASRCSYHRCPPQYSALSH